jgi:calcium-dependent protein kinase
MFDKDGSGKINASEIISLLQGDDVNDHVSREAIEQALKEIDQNGDGEIDFEEFMLMMRKVTEVDDNV